MPTVSNFPAIIEVTPNNQEADRFPGAGNRIVGATLRNLLEDIATKCGMKRKHYDFTAATDTLDGYQLPERTEGVRAIEEALRVFGYFLVEVDGKLKAVKRGGSVVATLADDDLGYHAEDAANEPNPKTRNKRKQPLDLPVEIDLTFYVKAAKYEQGNVRAQRIGKPHHERITINTPIVMTESFARRAAEMILYDTWNAARELQLVLPPKFIYLAPGDPLNVTVAGQSWRYRVVSIDLALFGVVQVNAVLDDAATLTQTITGGTLPAHTEETTLATATSLVVWSPPALRDVDAERNLPGFYFAMGTTSLGQDWPGAVLYMSRDSGATYQVVTSSVDPADFGVTLTALAALPANVGTGNWDRVNTVDVRLQSGQAPVSASEMEVLNGANAAMIGDEMIQFQTVTALGGNDYRLSNLLRGRRATNNFASSHLIGERFVLLDNGGGSTDRVEVEQSLIGKQVLLKAVTNGQSLAATSSQALTITGNELKPYDGTDGRGERNVPTTNDWTITWKRRTRCGGAWADLKDADLCELTEAYEAEIWNTGFTTLERTKTGLTSPSFVYTAAEQTTDFGSPQASLGIRVYQIGATGRGFVYQFTVSG